MIGLRVTVSPSLRHLQPQGAARSHDAEAQTVQEDLWAIVAT